MPTTAIAVGRQFAVGGHTRSPTFRRAAAALPGCGALLGSVTNPTTAVRPGRRSQGPADGSEVNSQRVLSEAPCSSRATGGSTPKSPRTVLRIRHRHKRIHAQFGQWLLGVEGCCPSGSPMMARMLAPHSPDDHAVHLGGFSSRNASGPAQSSSSSSMSSSSAELGRRAEVA